MYEWANNFALLWFCTFPTEFFLKDAAHALSLETLKLRSCWNNKKGPAEDPLEMIRPDWSLLVEENKAPAETKSFNCVGRSSSCCCSDHIISNTRSNACANSSWHDSTSVHRLHIHNHTYTNTHFPPSLSQTHSVFYGMFIARVERKMSISRHRYPLEKKLSSHHCNCVG